MANTRLGNKIYVDTAGEALVAQGPIKVSYILFTPDTALDQMILRETASGADIVIVRGAVAKDTKYFDFSRSPMVFQNGIYVQTLTSGAKAVIVTTSGGG